MNGYHLSHNKYFLMIITFFVCHVLFFEFFVLQQRLRNLIQVFGYNLCGDADNIANVTFYYTLHLSLMCAPLYTSEKISSPNPQWAKINVCSSISSAKGTYSVTFHIAIWLFLVFLKNVFNRTNDTKIVAYQYGF